ncbi:MAG TPA: type III pantothenate kinase [Nocardioidaceae bacterium]|nr:type III pantothenate kinase [Nocardioidaceae bacterium]
MSVLCLDVGNSVTGLGLFTGDELVAHWRVSSATGRTADEWGLLVRGLLADAGPLEPLTGLCVSSAVPAVLHELRAMLAGYYPAARHLLVGAGVRTGLPVLVDNPREVGTDRIANAVAAADRFGGPVVVVGLGTATTIDVVDAAGRFVGGVIAAGVESSLAALGARGAQLRQVELMRPRSVIAKNTIEALQSGAVYGFAGQVDGIVRRIAAELGSPPALEVVATGVHAPDLVDECATVTRHEPHLTLHGLQIIYERNR